MSQKQQNILTTGTSLSLNALKQQESKMAALPQPRPPQLLERNHESLTIAWLPLGSDALYEVQMIDDTASEEAWITLTSTFKAHFLRKKNLIAGIGYRFRVRGVSSDDTPSEFSSASDSFYVLPSDFQQMAAPTFLTNDGSSITMQWDSVEIATGYRLRWRREEDISWTTVESVLSGTTGKKKGLLPGNYYFSVLPLPSDESNWGYSNAGGPFKIAELHPVMATYLPTTLITKTVSTASTATLLSGKVICCYMSASWCGPCRNFTPRLIEFYNTIILSHRQAAVEIVFCSADHSEEDFKEYYSEMPWPAIDFNDVKREQLMGILQVRGIPQLTVLTPNGQVIVQNAVGMPMTVSTVDHWIEQGKQMR